MWLLVFLFFLMTLLLGWTLFGYLILVWFVGLFRRSGRIEMPASWPMISLIIPCYNEQDRIIEKLENTRKLDYPRDRLEVVFADGGSWDETCKLLNVAIGSDEPFRVIVCPRSGKIQQLNHVLPRLRGEIVVNSDTDSRLAQDALKWIAAEFVAEPDVWVVGAYCRPGDDAMLVEKYYWDAQNKTRFMETDARTSSIVIAQCYGFRRELLKAFPDDVVADDVYVAFFANTERHLTVYSRKAIAVETRSPDAYSEFLPHKFRKSNAFLRESLRFSYRLPEMGPFCKIMFATRVTQQLLLPWTALLWLLVAGVLLTMFRFDVVALGAGFLFLLLLATNRVFASVKLPDGPRRYSVLTVINGYILTNIIMLATALSYPFFRQGSSYTRVGRRIAETNDDKKAARLALNVR